MFCENCGAKLQDNQAFCSECGAALKKVCQRCGTELQSDELFCASCGQKADETPNTNVVPPIYPPNTHTSHQTAAASITSLRNMIPKQLSNIPVPALIGGISAAVIAIIFIFIAIGGGTSFERKFSDIADKSYCEISSDGSYMIIDTNPLDIEDYYGADAMNSIEKINKKLGFSDSVYQKMLQTRSLDGRLSEANKKYTVSWTYHPDNGLEVIYEKK